jgi:hypothetical protein
VELGLDDLDVGVVGMMAPLNAPPRSMTAPDEVVGSWMLSIEMPAAT